MGVPLNESSTLLNAQIGFLQTRLALVHIPTNAYPLFVQPILQLLLHNDRHDDAGRRILPSRPWNYWYPFVNVSLTPYECSIVCPRDVAERLFSSSIAALSHGPQKGASINKDDYSAIQIGGEGLDAAQRVLDLTSPLALAGIPIFFITSYYSDFIIVPHRSRSKVIHALEEQGFVFEASSENGEAGQMTNPASPIMHPHQRQESSSSSSDFFPPTTNTPPPSSVSELQLKTFKLLAKNNITPLVDPSIQLLTCAGIKDSSTLSDDSSTNTTEAALYHSLTLCLTSYPPPKFLSITLTDAESASLTLEKRLLSFFPDGGEDVLLGNNGPEQIPITLDLKELPLESTGIVCGVASRLTDGMKGRMGRDMFSMSYLSTAKAGHVIVYEDELDDVVDSLKGARLINGESS